ncbi:MAG: Lon protease [Porticoccaceae bacterium]|nr:MAG: Lon protease [Porticoccaceae bacterium]
MSREIHAQATLPLLPLRDVVVFPQMVVPLFVGREKSILALEAAMSGGRQVLLVAQRDPAEDDPGRKGIYDVGTVANILQLLKLPDGTVKVLVEGCDRVQVVDLSDQRGYLEARYLHLEETGVSEVEAEVFSRTLLGQFEQYVNLSKKVPAEVVSTLAGIRELDRLVDTITAHMAIPLEKKQRVLETASLQERAELLLGYLNTEIEVIQIEKRIRGRVKQQMEKSQREYYLNEQIKAIQRELGESEEGINEIQELEKRIKAAGMPKAARDKALGELRKLKMMSPMSAEASVVRSYIDWMLSVPWKKRTKVRHDIPHAEQVLNEDHYGLDEVKERILEFLAVQKRVRKIKGPVLCLVGPPGVGKTSLGESIARATGRKFVRMSLGGVRDEAEIRGHRRTYIGALPGKIIQKMAKVGVKNPLFLLDEVDKIGMDYRGDPAAALLEVLDPEQNSTFNDHYLEVDYDLSEVMFVCTANSLNIPEPLLDRMEVIRIPGYTEDEKVNIALKYLLPKQIRANGLGEDEVRMDEAVVRDVIRHYTREAGVRGLEREIAKICRKVLIRHVKEGDRRETFEVTSEVLEDLLGVRRFDFGKAEEDNQVGQVTGLAWTSVGGELLTIEAAAVPGKGEILCTGLLEKVMQESIQAARTVVRARSQQLGIPKSYHSRYDLHIHLPEGAIPKDGPSAGIAICTAMVSVLTGIPVRADVAMTGEITLRGQVLRIGGLKEKLLAAHRGGIKTVIIPKDNERDLKEIPENIVKALDIRPVKWIDEVLQIALEHLPQPLSDEAYERELPGGGAVPEEGKDSRLSAH